MEYETVWNGAHGGENRDLLCAAAPEVRDLGYVRPAVLGLRYRDLSAEHAKIVRALGQRARWHVSELREATGIDSRTMSGLLKRLERDGQLTRVCHGVVSRGRAA